MLASTMVPTRSPRTALSMLPGVFMLNTQMGSALSMHSEMAVASIEAGMEGGETCTEGGETCCLAAAARLDLGEGSSTRGAACARRDGKNSDAQKTAME